MLGPNPEQLKAIEHSGGMLLQAGAGSGKTFVLIHHLIYLFEDYYKKNQKEYYEDKSSLRRFLSSIVVFTFTTEASKELSNRLKRKISDKIIEIKEQNNGDSNILEYFEDLKFSIDALNLSTIHSFLNKLVKLGYVPKLKSNERILNNIEYLNKIKFLFNDAIIKNPSLINHSVFKIGETRIFEIFIKIFSDPTLRLKWRDSKIKSTDVLTDVMEIWFEFKKLKSCEHLYQKIQMLNTNDLKGKIAEFFINLKQIYPVNESTFEDVKIKNAFYENVGRFPNRPKNNEEISNFIDVLKIEKEFYIKNFENFNLYLENFEYLNEQYIKPLKELFDIIESNYMMVEGISFSDLEYFVALSLKDEVLQSVLSENFKYFIIDEFQDTSFIQFNIVCKIVQENYKRIFCVGDPKQAIYGFRGGELAVLEECEKNIPINHKLLNNYRSFQNIVNFNNSLFREILPLGPGFESKDLFPVSYFDQVAGLSSAADLSDKVICHKINLKINSAKTNVEDSKIKLKSIQIDQIESLIIVDKIKNYLLEQNNQSDVAVLYKKMGPAKLLISHLIKENIGFKATLKISFLEDPIVGIFYYTIEYLLAKDKNIEFYHLLIKNLIKVISDEYKITSQRSLEVIEQFQKDYALFDLSLSFKKLIYAIGIITSDWENSLGQISVLCKVNKNNLEQIYLNLKELKQYSYKDIIEFGKNSNYVKIMSAHASKGLEFDYVILGGTNTNAKEAIDKDLVGKEYGSIKYFLEEKGKKAISTPQFLLEKQRDKLKNFSESKRLLYVACTRAKRELCYFEFSSDEVDLVKDKNNWINAFKKFEEIFKIISIGEDFIINNKENENNDDVILPSFHFDQRKFLVDNDIEIKKQNNFLILPELSITRMITLLDCPKKFYFKNILKINEDFFDKENEAQLSFNENLLTGNSSDQEQNSNQVKSSNSERGTLIHRYLYLKLIENLSSKEDFELIKLEKIISKSKKTIRYLEQITKDFNKLRSDYTFILEKEFKFDIFGFMATGIPDLILFPIGKNLPIVIVDYKTGSLDEDKLNKYFYQLSFYVFCLNQINPKIQIQNEDEVKLSILAIDEGKEYKRVNTFESIKSELWTFFLSLNNLEVKNLSHCSQCGFSQICNS